MTARGFHQTESLILTPWLDARLSQLDFGMKVHIGIDDQSRLVHTVVGTTAKVSDMSRFGALLQGEEERVSADRGCEHLQIHARLEENLIEGWVVRKARPGKSLNAWTCNLHHAIAQVRAIGERLFRIIERRFADTKARDRGLGKNTAPLVTLFAPGNPYPARAALPAMG